MRGRHDFLCRFDGENLGVYGQISEIIKLQKQRWEITKIHGRREYRRGIFVFDNEAGRTQNFTYRVIRPRFLNGFTAAIFLV